MRVDVGIALFRCFYSREAAHNTHINYWFQEFFKSLASSRNSFFFFLSVAYLSLIMPFKLSSHILHKLFPNLLLSLTFVLLYFSMDFLALKIGEFLSKAICTCLLNGIKSHTWSFEISKCYFIGFTDIVPVSKLVPPLKFSIDHVWRKTQSCGEFRLTANVACKKKNTHTKIFAGNLT